ncbi:MAG: hypothetical protein LBL99_04630 [Holosporaceae bacterium]|jgi:archaellum component FlaC|nr:hypothetical protein [Holosporaceae bacterium]
MKKVLAFLIIASCYLSLSASLLVAASKDWGAAIITLPTTCPVVQKTTVAVQATPERSTAATGDVANVAPTRKECLLEQNVAQLAIEPQVASSLTLSAQLNQTKAELTAALSRINDLESQLAAARYDTEQLNSELSTTSQRVRDLTADQTRMQKKLDSRDEQIEALTTEINELKTTVADLRATLDRLRGELTQQGDELLQIKAPAEFNAPDEPKAAVEQVAEALNIAHPITPTAVWGWRKPLTYLGGAAALLTGGWLLWRYLLPQRATAKETPLPIALAAIKWLQNYSPFDGVMIPTRY